MWFHDRYKKIHLFISIMLTALDPITGRIMSGIFANIDELRRPYETHKQFKYRVLLSVQI
jgi:hypothetical protein